MSAEPGHVDPLWSRVLAGDADAFGLVFDAHKDRVYGHAVRLVEDPHQAEDVTALAFLELWRRRDQARVVSGTVLPWLLVTTTNVARNQRRAARRYRRFLAALPRAATVPAADVASVMLDLTPALREALTSLRGPDLHLLVLIAIEDYAVADAAQALGISEAAAKSRMHRIRHRVRDSLGVVPTDDPLWRTR
ncbi:RNA polymerase sigma factor [Nocardioides sp.]|uniref:RNA polymerase sigma factor n=1 Tax=Nocardioides sp. TaxID=35761 RepID=UPI0026025BA1|nr:RNA polymerase sigma factor [Nocardioides sp.]